jgi:hypothetical protein
MTYSSLNLNPCCVKFLAQHANARETTAADMTAHDTTAQAQSARVRSRVLILSS